MTRVDPSAIRHVEEPREEAAEAVLEVNEPFVDKNRFEALGSEDEVCAPAVPEILVARPLRGRWRTSVERARVGFCF